MSIARTIQALQTVHRGIPGIRTAPTTYPRSLVSGDLPLVLTWPSAGSGWQEAMNSLRRMERTYLVRCYVDAVGQGIADDKVQLSIGLLQRFYEAYIDPNTFALYREDGTQATIQVSSESPITDSGIVTLPYGPLPDKQAYHGFEILVTVFEKW